MFSLKIMTGRQSVAAEYIARRTGDAMHDPFRTISVWEVGGGCERLIGALAVDRWTGFGAEVSGAGRAIMLRSARQALCDLVFGYLGCRRMSITVRKSNKPMQRMAARLGFVFEGKARKYYGSEDGIVYSMLSEEAAALGHWMPRKVAA